MKSRKLGRGLDMLIKGAGKKGDSAGSAEPAGVGSEDAVAGREGPVATALPEGFQMVEVDPHSVSANPEQPRRKFPERELEMLKSSISREGLLQPILVRQVGDVYQLIAGERRLRAAQDLDLARIPAVVAEVADERLLELALIENLQRQDLNPIEVAQAYQRLIKEKGWTQEQLAEGLGLRRSSVANTLRLLELPGDMQDALVRAHISPGHAKVLLSVGEPKRRRVLFERIAEEKLTVRDLEQARDGTTSSSLAALESEVASSGGDAEPSGVAGGPARPPGRRPKKKGAKPAAKPRRKGQVQSLEEEWSDRLATKVRIEESKGKGRIIIEFYSPEDFERIEEELFS